ncbi:RebB family R body protein [Kordiimonas sp. SCSIO 12603]|uniref:RebB family R body protein n=1 Tax=Kordiimonas sp. SCSIO 12603 TaxID=2829596 RepID=UPI002102D192|nr:RebB family R body protein [Kordiimonas sp. SCSIO 12603]UTW57097.1 RebB family R body protein [Kordiimonas sp. SCSIO 12603]
MADSSGSLNRQITEAVDYANQRVLGESGRVASGVLQQSAATSLSVLFASSVQANQRLHLLADQITAESAARMRIGAVASSGKAKGKA